MKAYEFRDTVTGRTVVVEGKDAKSARRAAVKKADSIFKDTKRVKVKVIHPNIDAKPAPATKAPKPGVQAKPASHPVTPPMTPERVKALAVEAVTQAVMQGVASIWRGLTGK